MSPRALLFVPLLALNLFAGAAQAQMSPAPSAQSHSSPLSPEQVEAIERLIRDYLLRNPQIVLEAVEKLEQSRRDEATRASSAAIAAAREELVNDSDALVVGDPRGDATLVEFFDYQCPYCKQMEPGLRQLIKDDGRLRVVYKEYPILGPGSTIAARAALAARRQNKYAELHMLLIDSRGELDEERVMSIARTAGLNIDRLKVDMQAPEIDAILERNAKLARAIGVDGTPGFVIGETLVPGAVEIADLKTMLAGTRRK